MERCFGCGQVAELRQEYREIQLGSRSAVVEHEFYYCPQCDEEFLTPDQIDAIQRRASRRIREEEGLLQSEEIRAFRERLGLSQEAFERLLGVGPKTAVRWEKGVVFQNRATDNLLRVLMEFPEATRFLAQRHGVQLPDQALQKPDRAVRFGHFGAELVVVCESPSTLSQLGVSNLDELFTRRKRVEMHIRQPVNSTPSAMPVT